MTTPEEQISEAKELILGLSFQWYQERLIEIESFRSKSTSSTATELIDTAKSLTTLTYKEWDELRNVAMGMIGSAIEHYEKVCAQENEELREAHEKMMLAATAESDIEERIKELEYWSNIVFNNFEKSVENKQVVSDAALAITSAFVDTSKSLLHETYKPDYRSFHKESAKGLLLHLLKKLDWLSLLDDYEVARKIDPKYRICSHLEFADKAFEYLEKYNEQLVEWVLVARKLKAEMANVESGVNK